jgi:hypothetical protein
MYSGTALKYRIRVVCSMDLKKNWGNSAQPMVSYELLGMNLAFVDRQFLFGA